MYIYIYIYVIYTYIYVPCGVEVSGLRAFGFGVEVWLLLG